MGHVKPVIAVTGTRREGMVLANAGVRVIAAGGDASALARQLAELAPGAAGLISFGMAGAIDRSLDLGDWVVGKRLVGSFPANCDARWAQALIERIPGARLGAVQADGRLLSDPFEKEHISARSAALVVDMESHIVAEAAAWAGIPFAILRCVSDTTGMQLPPAVDVMMRPDGSIDMGAVAGSLVSHPGQIPSFVRTLAAFARANGVMGKGAQAIGDRLGFDAR